MRTVRTRAALAEPGRDRRARVQAANGRASSSKAHAWPRHRHRDRRRHRPVVRARRLLGSAGACTTTAWPSPAAVVARLAQDLVAEARDALGLSGTTQRAAREWTMRSCGCCCACRRWSVRCRGSSELALAHIALVDGQVVVGEARARVDPARTADPCYRHMAIHPYPGEPHRGRCALADGTSRHDAADPSRGRRARARVRRRRCRRSRAISASSTS